MMHRLVSQILTRYPYPHPYPYPKIGEDVSAVQPALGVLTDSSSNRPLELKTSAIERSPTIWESEREKRTAALEPPKVFTDSSSKGKHVESPRTYPKVSHSTYAKPSSSSSKTPYDPGTATSKKVSKNMESALVKPSTWITPLVESTKVSHSTYGKPSGPSSRGKDENFTRADDTTRNHQKSSNNVKISPTVESVVYTLVVSAAEKKRAKQSQKLNTHTLTSATLSPPKSTHANKAATTRLPPIDHNSSEISATHASLTAAALQMDTLLQTRFGGKYIYTALEVLFFAKGSKSLHFGEYPAKVHWPQVPDPVSNPCCRRVADVLGKNYALVDLLPMRSRGLSGDISFKNVTQELLKDGKYVQALTIYFKCSIEYFSAAMVFPVWGQANAKLVSKLDIGVNLLPMAHPSGHGQRRNPTHFAKIQYDLQMVLAHINSPHDIKGYLRSLASAEAIRVEKHVKDLEALEMRSQVLLSLRPTILHLVEQKWVKRIELASFLKQRKVKVETLELFFCASLRLQSVQGIKKGIANFVGAIHNDFHLVYKRVSSSGDSGVKRLVDDPLLFLQSLQTVASKLGKVLPSVWTTVCASGGSGVKCLVNHPLLFLQSLQTVASKLGKVLPSVWTTICASGNSGVKRLVDNPLLFLQSLQTMASKLDKELPLVWTTICALGNSGVKRLVDDPLLFLQSLQNVASQLGKELPSVWTTICASGNSSVKRLVDDPLLFLRSMQIVASKLGKVLPSVWTTICASRNSSVKRIIDNPLRYMQSLQTVASKLGMELHSVWTQICHSRSVRFLVDEPLRFYKSLQTVASKLGKELQSVYTTICSSGKWAVKRLVEGPDRFVDALIIVAEENSMSAWDVFCMLAGCSSMLWNQLINEPDSVGKILSDTPYDNYALVKLVGQAETNFWRNAEVRGAAQAHLIDKKDWAKIKAVLSNQAVDTAEKFDIAISKLKPEDTPRYSINARPRQYGDPQTKSTGSIFVICAAIHMVPNKPLFCTLKKSTRSYLTEAPRRFDRTIALGKDNTDRALNIFNINKSLLIMFNSH
jgi:hypothetical protein